MFATSTFNTREFLSSFVEFKGECFVAIYISFNIDLSQKDIIGMCKGLCLKLCIHLSVFDFM